jgi:hypothetical protein
MSEETLFLPETFFQIIRLVAFFVFVLAITAFFIVAFKGSELNHIEKSTREAASFIANNKATDGRSIFVEEELDEIVNKDERFYRHCGYGYEIIIKNDKKEWVFRDFTPDNALTATKEIKIGLKKSREDFIEDVGTLRVSLYSNYMAQLSCVIEDVYTSAKVQDMTYADWRSLDAAILTELDYENLKAPEYGYPFTLKKEGNNLCTTPEDTEKIKRCIRNDAPFREFNLVIKPVDRKVNIDIMMKIVPIKDENVVKLPSLENIAGFGEYILCDDLQGLEATKSEDVGQVVLCITDPSLITYDRPVPA